MPEIDLYARNDGKLTCSCGERKTFQTVTGVYAHKTFYWLRFYGLPYSQRPKIEAVRLINID